MLERKNKIIRKGVTLIELLVVLAIIFILTSILYPVFNQARENSRKGPNNTSVVVPTWSQRN